MITTSLKRALPLEGPYPLTADRLIAALTGGPTASGAHVNASNALSLTAVSACVQVLTDNIASLPSPLYRRLARGKERAIDHPLYRVLHTAPNPYMTPMTFKETVMGHLLLWGNSYSSVVRNQAGTPAELWPLRPNDVVKLERSASGELLYTYRLPKTGEERLIPQREMLHIRGLSDDGITGYSPIALHREALGLTKAADEFGARFFANGMRPSGYLQAKTRLSAEAAERLKATVEGAHRGLENFHRLMVLEEGVGWKATGIPPNDGQWLATRQYQLQEAARIYRVPPHKLADLSHATYSNIDKLEQSFLLDVVRPWLVRLEQAMNLALLTPQEQATLYVEFLMDASLRADIKTRYEAYGQGRQWGYLSANDIREMENMNPIDGGDDYWQPVNMAIVGQPVPQTGQGGFGGAPAEA